MLLLPAEGTPAEALIAALEEAGLRAEAVSRRLGNVEAVLRRRPDLVAIDAAPPSEPALRLSRRLRGDPRAALLPVVLFNTDPRIGAADAGADECLPRQTPPRAMGERFVAILRRRGILPEAADVCIGPLTVSPSRHKVFVHGRPVSGLTLIEFRTLHALAARAGRVLTREQILVATHGEESGISERAVDVQVVGLRRKLGAAASLIESVRGVGYRMSDESE